MRYLSIIVILACFAACNNTSESNQTVSTDTPGAIIRADSSEKYIHTFADTVLEAKITDALMKLSFVKKSNDYIDSFSNHKHGISFMMDKQKEDEKEILVKAGYNGGERFETYYHFVVEPKTMNIKVFDPVEDKTLTLNEYIKTQQ